MINHSIFKGLAYIHLMALFLLTKSLGAVALILIDQLWAMLHVRQRSLLECVLESKKQHLVDKPLHFAIEFFLVVGIAQCFHYGLYGAYMSATVALIALQILEIAKQKKRTVVKQRKK